MLPTADETIDMGRAGYLKALYTFYLNEQIIQKQNRERRKKIFPLKRKRRRVCG